MSFDSAFAYLLDNEGILYANNPLDSGGPTKFGITLKAYSHFVGRLVSEDEMKNLVESEAGKFYEEVYWKPLSCDAIAHPGIATAMFDTGVLYGIYNSIEFAQKALNCSGIAIKSDGLMGQKTVDALNVVEPEKFIVYFYQFVVRRIDDVIRKNPKNEAFKKGWIARAEKLLSLKETA